MTEKNTVEEVVEQILARMSEALGVAILRMAGNDRDAVRALRSAISRDRRLCGIPQGWTLARGGVTEPCEALSGVDDEVERVCGHVQDAMYTAFYESCGSVQAMPVLMTAMRMDDRIRPMLRFKSDEDADAAYREMFDENGQVRRPE